MPVRQKWLRLTEETNALDYLEKAAWFIQQTEQDLLVWKWVVLSLHSALYGFAICACKGTSYKNVTKKTKHGKDHLINCDEALKRCRVVFSESQKDSMRRLNKDLRNNMEHYVPSGWSIEVHGMPVIAIDVLDVIRFLALETRTFNQAQIKGIKSYVFQSKRFLEKTKLYQESMETKTVYHAAST